MKQEEGLLYIGRLLGRAMKPDCIDRLVAAGEMADDRVYVGAKRVVEVLRRLDSVDIDGLPEDPPKLLRPPLRTASVVTSVKTDVHAALPSKRVGVPGTATTADRRRHPHPQPSPAHSARRLLNFGSPHTASLADSAPRAASHNTRDTSVHPALSVSVSPIRRSAIPMPPCRLAVAPPPRTDRSPASPQPHAQSVGLRHPTKPRTTRVQRYD